MFWQLTKKGQNFLASQRIKIKKTPEIPKYKLIQLEERDLNVLKLLNDKYGIGGSPTLVINGAQANSGRDSVSYLRTICAAFNDAPEACNTELSSAQPSPGFGYETTSGSTTTAQCG